MNFIETYVDLLMSHPLTTPIVSVGLLALTLHLVLPLLCEIWRYYPNKITGKETVKNWYLDKITIYKITYFSFEEHMTCTERFYIYDNYSKRYDDLDDNIKHWDLRSERVVDFHYKTLSLLAILCSTSVVSILTEYLLANFFIYTLVAGLAVGLHFTVVLLGKKVYSISEDVKTLKESCTKENTSEEPKEGNSDD
jgi:hypothetical protein